MLQQLADSMNCKHDELSVSLPTHTTWSSAIQAVQEALGNVDEDFLLMPQRVGNHQAIREIRLQAVSALNVSGLPIWTNVDLSVVEHHPAHNETTREHLRKIAKESAADIGFLDLYVSLWPKLQDKCLPIIWGNLGLQVLDGNPSDPICKLKEVEMIFDTGAHRSIIAEELLPIVFQNHLKDLVHDPYQLNNCLSVQLDAGIALMNCPVVIEAVAFIMPRSRMPNKLLGILLGQLTCIDRLSLQMTPRRILLARNQNIPEEFWGDIVLDQYLDSQDEVVSL